MSNPFDDLDAQYLVLVNEELQYSLWPVFVDVPAGWTIARGAGSHSDSVAFVEENWTDMRPKSLVDRMATLAEGDAKRGDANETAAMPDGATCL